MARRNGREREGGRVKEEREENGERVRQRNGRGNGER